MTFIWPAMLVALAAVPFAVWAYVAHQRRRAARTRALAESGLVLTGPAPARGRRRHIPVVLFLGAFAALMLALSRPQVSVALPRQTGTVILVFDLSNSMRADDLQPTRLEAAQVAARDFVEEQPSGVEIGLVAFSSGAQTPVTPTTERGEVLDAIDRLDASGGTATGSGLFAALNAIAGEPIPISEGALASGDIAAVDVGFFPSSAIVLLSDGETTGGPDPLAVAELASTAGVKVTTIGVGSVEGAIVDVEGFQVATTLDETMLQGIADITGGTYIRSTDTASLAAAYDSLDLRWERQGEVVEITGLLSIGAVVLIVIGAVLSIRWLGRVV